MIQVLPYLIIGAAMYGLLLYPQQRKNKAHQQLLASLSEGDEVLTNAGIYGFIKEIEPDILWIEVAEGTELRIARGAIQSKISGETDNGAADEDTADDDSTEADA